MKLNTSIEVFELSVEEKEMIEREKSFYEDSRAVAIESLKMIQKNHGWISDEAMVAISKILCISVSDLEEIATFYSQIFRKKVGRHIIRYCDSIVCYIMGCQNIQVILEKLLNIKIGQTTLDNKFTLLPICCLGKCDVGPVMMIDNDTYTHLTINNIHLILEQYR